MLLGLTQVRHNTRGLLAANEGLGLGNNERIPLWVASLADVTEVVTGRMSVSDALERAALEQAAAAVASSTGQPQTAAVGGDSSGPAPARGQPNWEVEWPSDSPLAGWELDADKLRAAAAQPRVLTYTPSGAACLCLDLAYPPLAAPQILVSPCFF
jgi:hypothetical protein